MIRLYRFYSNDCPACIKHIAEYIQLKREFLNKKIIFVDINTSEGYNGPLDLYPFVEKLPSYIIRKKDMQQKEFVNPENLSEIKEFLEKVL